jgi:manganese efflux pump family protein
MLDHNWIATEHRSLHHSCTPAGWPTAGPAGNYGNDVLALILVAVSVGLSNFAVAIGIGISGTSTRTRLKVGIIFGLFETGMPIAGLALGRGLAEALGHSARWISAGLLIATGAWTVFQAVRSDHQAPTPDRQSIGRLMVTGLAISVDNFAVGFALGEFHVNLAVAAAVIGGISIAMSLIGLELGAQIGARAGQRGELLGGVVLIAVGAAIAAGLI